MTNQINYSDLRSKLNTIQGDVPPEFLKAGFDKHVAQNVAVENIDAFVKALQLVAKKGDDEQLKAYIESGEQPVLALSSKEMEVLKGGETGYGANYETSTPPPSVAGFIAYLVTGYINGYQF